MLLSLIIYLFGGGGVDGEKIAKRVKMRLFFLFFMFLEN